MALLEGLKPWSRARLGTEVLAGVTLAAIGIPEVMGYSDIAGMPIVTGLYTMVLPLALFALLGSSKHLVVAADSATAAILAAGLAGLAVLASPRYVALAGLVAILTGLALLLVRVLRLGFLANFLSRTLLVGFLAGVGISVAVSQLPAMLGLHLHRSGTTLPGLVDVVRHLGQSQPLSVLLSLISLAVLLGAKSWNRRRQHDGRRQMPVALVVVVSAIVISAATGLQGHGIATVGHLAAGLPRVSIGQVHAKDWMHLVSVAFSLVVVIVAQSAATSSAYAARYRENLDEDRDLAALGLANVVAGATGAYVVNGSPTKTEIIDDAGSRSQQANLAAAAVTLVVVFFLTGPLAYLPKAVLASVVAVIAVGLIEVRELGAIRRRRRDEYAVALLTAASVIIFGVEFGIFIAVVICLLNHLRRSYSPENLVMSFAADGAWEPHPVTDAPMVLPGLFIYRFQASLYYANAPRLALELRQLAARHPVCICLDCSAVADVDVTASEVLQELAAELEAEGIRLVLSHVAEPVEQELRRYMAEQQFSVELIDRTHEVLGQYGGSAA